jgi:hypothetical protein
MRVAIELPSPKSVRPGLGGVHARCFHLGGVYGGGVFVPE